MPIKHLRDSKGRYQAQFHIIRGTKAWTIPAIAFAIYTFGYICVIFPIKPVFAEQLIKDTRVHELYCDGFDSPCVPIGEFEIDFPEKKIETHGIINGYNIKSYATNPKHEENVKRIYQSVKVNDSYIQQIAKGSPVTAKMVMDSANKYNVDSRLMMAIMQEDSQFGTVGVGARTNNPGNIANYDNGSTFEYKSWANGIEGVARWLSRHRVDNK